MYGLESLPDQQAESAIFPLVQSVARQSFPHIAPNSPRRKNGFQTRADFRSASSASLNSGCLDFSLGNGRGTQPLASVNRFTLLRMYQSNTTSPAVSTVEVMITAKAPP